MMFLTKLFNIEKKMARVVTFTLGFSNVVYIPLTLSMAIVNDTDLFEDKEEASGQISSYISGWLLPFTILFWSIGKGYISKNNEEELMETRDGKELEEGKKFPQKSIEGEEEEEEENEEEEIEECKKANIKMRKLEELEMDKVIKEPDAEEMEEVEDIIDESEDQEDSHKAKRNSKRNHKNHNTKVGVSGDNEISNNLDAKADGNGTANKQKGESSQSVHKRKVHKQKDSDATKENDIGNTLGESTYSEQSNKSDVQKHHHRHHHHHQDESHSAILISPSPTPESKGTSASLSVSPEAETEDDTDNVNESNSSSSSIVRFFKKITAFFTKLSELYGKMMANLPPSIARIISAILTPPVIALIIAIILVPTDPFREKLFKSGSKFTVFNTFLSSFTAATVPVALLSLGGLLANVFFFLIF